MRSSLKTRLVISLTVIAGLIFSFTQLSLRKQGLIVEYVTFGDWPLEWAVRRQFEEKQPELRLIAEFFKKSPSVVGLKISAVGLRASSGDGGPEGSEYDLDDPNILQALVSVDADFAESRDDRVAVMMGTEVRGPTLFELAYHFGPWIAELPECHKIRSTERAEIGSCGLDLGSGWFARYAWYPVDPVELERAVDELR